MKKLMSLLSLFLLLVIPVACEEDEDSVPETNGAAVVEAFLTHFQAESPDVFELFNESAIIHVMMNPDGTQNPTIYDGIDAIEAYFNQIFTIFSPVRFTDIRITTADNGRTVFAQANGQFTVEESSTPYNNVYILRFDINETGQIVATEEYLNWVVNGEFLGQPLGSCQERICN